MRGNLSLAGAMRWIISIPLQLGRCSSHFGAFTERSGGYTKVVVTIWLSLITLASRRQAAKPIRRAQLPQP